MPDKVQSGLVDFEKIGGLFEQQNQPTNSSKKENIRGNNSNVINVLDNKRSQKISIAMRKLPKAETIKSAITNMDNRALPKDSINILLQLLPTEEELELIRDAKHNAPADAVLADAEQFLDTLATITDLNAWLKLWDFKLDFEALIETVADPLTDLRDAINELQESILFKQILVILLEIGSYLNEKEVQAIELSFLSRCSEVKDTVKRQTLLYHIVSIIIEKHENQKFKDSDLYSDFPAVSRAARIDFQDMNHNLSNLEKKCKASWEHIREISKTVSSNVKARQNLTDFVYSAAKETVILKVTKNKIMDSYKNLMKFSLLARDVTLLDQPNTFFRIIGDFALDYKTTRQKYIDQKANLERQRERARTRGQMVEKQKIRANSVAQAKFKKQRSDDRARQIKNDQLSRDMEEAIGGSMLNLSQLGRRESKAKKTSGMSSIMSGLKTMSGNLMSGLTSGRSKTLPGRSHSIAVPNDDRFNLNMELNSSAGSHPSATELNSSREVPILESDRAVSNPKLDGRNRSSRQRPSNRRIDNSIPEGISLDDDSISAILTSSIPPTSANKPLSRTRPNRRSYMAEEEALSMCHNQTLPSYDQDPLSSIITSTHHVVGGDNFSQNSRSRLMSSNSNASQSKTAVFQKSFNKNPNMPQNSSQSRAPANGHYSRELNDLNSELPEGLPPMETPTVIHQNSRTRRRRRPQ